MIRYIVGIDYGHGETSAAFVDLQAQGMPVQDLTITGNTKVIHSMIVNFSNRESKDPNEWSLDPEWSSIKYAFEPEQMSKEIPPVAAYFKGPLCDGTKRNKIDELKELQFGIFCYKVYEEIIENNRFLEAQRQMSVAS